MRSTEDRYRTLLAAQPTIKAVLHRLRDVLSSTSRLHGTELYVLNEAQDSLRVLEFDRDPDAPLQALRRSRIGRFNGFRLWFSLWIFLTIFSGICS